MKIVIEDDDYKPFDSKVVKIDAWWDRHSRNYIIELLNKDGYQVGNAIVVGTKASRDFMVRELKQQYGL